MQRSHTLTLRPVAGLSAGASASSFVELLRRRAAEQPDRTVLTHLVDSERTGRSLTLEQLDRRARAIAVALLARAAPGDRCLLLHPQGLEWIEAFYGCLYAGMVAVPAYPPGSRRLGARIHGIVEDAQPALALTTAATLNRIAGREAEPGLEQLAWLATDDVPDDLADSWQAPKIGPDTLALLQYTSGSTATPTGVMVAHRNLLYNAGYIVHGLGLTEDSVSVTWMPFFHDAGLFAGVLQPVYTGLHTHILAPLVFLTNPLGWLRAVSRFGATTSGGPNFAYDLCARLATPEVVADLDLSRWSVALNGAEPVRAETLRRFAEVFAPASLRSGALCPTYGLAEATLMVSGGGTGPRPVALTVDASALRENRVVPLPSHPSEGTGAAEMTVESATQELVSSGPVFGQTRVLIVEPERRRLLPAGHVGEIWMNGPTVTQGYWGRPAETAETFQAQLAPAGSDDPAGRLGLPDGPYLRTGDLGFLRDGELFVTGRRKDLLIVRGRNHYPQDIERTAERSHPALREHAGAAFMVGDEHQSGAEVERLVIVQELQLGQQHADVEAVGSAVRRAVAEEHELQVHTVALVAYGSVPMTSSGKIRRRACRDGYLDGSLKVIGASTLAADGPAQLATDAAADPASDTHATPGTNSPQGPLGGVQPATLTRAELLAQPDEARRPLLEAYLRQLVAVAMRVPASMVPADRPLLDLGIDSLTGVRLAAAVETALGVTLSLTTFLDDPTVTSVATAVLEGLKASPEEVLSTGSTDIVSPASDTMVPLTHGQRALWLLHTLDPQGSAYNLSGAVRLRGRVDITALRGTFEAVVARHAALRTTITVQDGEPIGVIPPPLPRKGDDVGEADIRAAQRAGGRGLLGLLDFRAVAAPADPAALQQLLADEAARPFDLEHGPLLRALLVATGPDEHVLLVGTHHVAADLWSLGIVARDLGEAYAALTAGQEWHPAVPAISFADVAGWEQTRLAGPAAERDLAYWREQLAGAPPSLDLPTDRSRPPVQTFRGIAQAFELDADLVRQLRVLARSEDTTLYTVLLAAFQTFLHRYTGQDDVLVGSPVAGRTQSALAEVVGYCVNPLVFRADLGPGPSGRPTFRALLRQVRRTVLDGLAHQGTPFPLLVERLRPVRDARRSPLFQAMLVYQQPPTPELAGLTAMAVGAGGGRFQLGGLEIETVGLEPSAAQVDISLVLAESGGANSGLLGSLQLNADLFESAAAARLAEGFQTLLAAIVTEPERAVAELPLLPEGQRRQLLSDWNDTTVEYPGAACLHQLIEEQVARTPDAIAVTFEGHHVTFRELNRRANRLAHRLQALGVGPETLVGICADRSPELVVGLLAILKASGAYVPMDPEYPRERLAFMLADAQAPVLLTQRDLLSALPEHGGRTLLLDDPNEITGQPDENPDSPVGSRNLAYVIYTSGSTGRPKGAMNEHAGIRNRLLWMQAEYQLSPADTVLQKTPFSFDVSVWEFFWPLMTGARLVLARPGGHRDPSYLVGLIASERVTTLHFVPSMLQAFLEEPDLSGCGALRRVICSGEALPRALQDRFFARVGTPLGVELHNLYGPTEAAVDVSFWPCDPADPSDSVPIGRPVANTQLYVLDGQLEPAPVGVAGELHIGGVQVGRGYWQRPELTAERFVPDPFSATSSANLYKTGDLARFRADGAIEFLGRLDHQVKARGFRIELGEIEAALLAHPGVSEAVVMVCDGANGNDGQRLAAYLVMDQTGQQPGPSVEALRAHLGERLPEYMLPTAWTVLERMPLSPNGKLDRRRLPAPTVGTTSSVQVDRASAPASETEQLVFDVWASALGTEQFGVEDDFFAVGGDSLRAVRVVHGLAQRGWSVQLAALLQQRTVRGLARQLSRQGSEQASSESATVDGEASVLPGPPRLELAAISDEVRGALPPDTEAAYPLSWMQQLMVREYIRDADGTGVYHGQQRFTVEDARFSVDALAEAITLAVRRHRSLRTSLHLETKDGPVQAVRADLTPTVQLIDLRRLEAADQEAAIQAYLEADRARPFAVDDHSAPLCRFAAFQLSDTTAELAVSFHHAITDGWSNTVIQASVLELYRRLRGGSIVTNTDVQPADADSNREHIALEREIADSEAAAAFWADYLAGATLHESLPLAPGISVNSRAPEPLTAILDSQELAALRGQARKLGLSLKAFCLSAYLDTLAELWQLPGLTVGVVANGRSPRLSDPLGATGLFWSFVPVRRLAGLSDRAARAVAIQEHLIGLEPFAGYPLGQLARESSGRELLVATFNYTHFERPVRTTDDIRVLHGSFRDRFHLPLNQLVAIDAAADTLTLRIEYDRRSVSAEAAQAILEMYVRRLGSPDCG